MNELLEYLKSRKPGPFVPQPFLNKAGRLVEWYWKNDPSYAESVHANGAWVGTVERSIDSGEVTGVKIHLEAFMPRYIGYDFADLEN